MLERLIDRLTIAQALARCRDSAQDGPGVERALPVFASAGRRVGNPWVLGLDWSRLPEAYLSSPGASEVLRRALDALPARHRATVLIDAEGVAPADVAASLGEPPEHVRRRLHQARMAVRERLTEYFAAATARH